MKKQAISILLCASMVISSGIMAFAAETTAPDGEITPTVTIVPDMNFTGAEIKLSLNDAVKRMQTEGVRAQTAQINKQSDKSIADGYSETARTIRDTLEALSGADMSSSAAAEASGSTVVNQKITKMKRDFAKENLEKNYQAEMNKIEKDTVEMYYGVLQAQDNLTAAKDNLSIQNTVLTNVQIKFKAGVAAKKDLLSQETAVTTAKSKVEDAQVALNSAKMNFNMLLGYPLMQKVTLTDTLKEVAAPDATLADAIKSAQTNRMEIKLANLGVEAQKILLDNMKLTIATNSSSYLKQQVVYMTAQQGAENAPIQIEMDIRAQYMGLQQKKQALESAKATADFAREGFRLAQISYDAGVNTLTDVQEAQLQAFQANQAVSAAMTEYDLAVYAFKYAQNVGIERISL